MNKLMSFSILLFLFSCTENKDENVVSTPENEKIVKQYFAYFNQHDWVKMANMYAETVEFKDPDLGKGIIKQTRAEIIKKYTEMNQMFPEIRDEIVALYPSSDKNIIVEFVSKGAFPDGSKLELPICAIFTIENGLITKDFTYYDNFEEQK